MDQRNYSGQKIAFSTMQGQTLTDKILGTRRRKGVAVRQEEKSLQLASVHLK